MNDLLSDLPFCQVFMDDILIHSNSKSESEAHLQLVLKRLEDTGVKLNREKCCFHQPVVEFLGYTWSGEGIKISDKARNDILRAEFPTDRTALRSFLGLATYVCSNNVPHSSDLLRPLWDLLYQEVWNVTAKERHCFEEVKRSIQEIRTRKFSRQTSRLLSSATRLVMAWEQSFYVQDNEPVLFASRRSTDTEKRYSQIEKECLATVFAVNRFRHFLVGRHFNIQTDHKPLSTADSRETNRFYVDEVAALGYGPPVLRLSPHLH